MSPSSSRRDVYEEDNHTKNKTDIPTPANQLTPAKAGGTKNRVRFADTDQPTHQPSDQPTNQPTNLCEGWWEVEAARAAAVRVLVAD